MAKKSTLSSVSVTRLGDVAFLSVAVVFACFIFLPAVWVLGSMGSPRLFMSPVIIGALFLSLGVALSVALIDLLLGVPLAWMIVRSRNPILKWLDNLIDLSLVMPTAALGFSVYFYYSSEGIFRLFGFADGAIGKGPLLIFLLHVVFTLPYMVRSVSAAFLQQEAELEEAADSLGANPLSFFRTVALPLCRQGVVNGSILAFTRSLSETGATMMVAGAFFTAPVLVVQLKNNGDLSGAAGLSIALILLSLLILILTRARFGKRSFDLPLAHPALERKLSLLAPQRNIVLTAVFLLIVFMPTIYLVLYYFFNFQLVSLGPIWGSLVLSFGIAGAVTLINSVLALPLSYMVARNRLKLGALIENLNEVILLVPTSALGLSLALFWGRFSGSELVVLTLAHLCFTFPYFVKPLVTAFSNISIDQEEAARSLGSGPAETFRLVLLPQIKPALITGAIMAFMRSISETGATLAVSQHLKTVSVLIVDLFKQERLAEAALACIVLFACSLVFLFLLKRFEDGAVPAARDAQ